MKKFSRTHVPLVPLLLLTSKCRLVLGTTSTVSLDTLRVAEGSPALGRGYSMTTNSFFSSCFDVNATTTEHSANFVFDFIDFIDEEDDLKLESKQIAESFAYDEIKNIVEDKTRYTAVATLRIERIFPSLLETSDDLSTKYKNMLNDEEYINFFMICGPNYVRSFKRAQEATAIITFDADDDARAHSFAESLKLHIFGNGARRGSKISSLVTSVMPSSSPSASPSSQPSAQLSSDDFNNMKNSLHIEMFGYGLGLNSIGSGTLVAASLDELNKVMKYAFDSMTKPSSDEIKPSYPKGMTYQMEVAPWTDNAEFLNYVGVNSHKIFAPAPRGMIENAKSGPKPCSKSSLRPDDFGKCCSPHEMISVATVNDIGSTVQLTSCEPKMSISGEIMKDNLQTNAEFIASMASVHQEKVQSLSKLGKCIRDLRALPEKFDYMYLHSSNKAVYDPAIEMRYLVKELKTALNPMYSLVIMDFVSQENDEYFEMFYQPCLAALYEMQYGEKKLNHPKFIMARPWYNVEKCMHLSCLEKNMAWDRKNGEGCVPGILGRQSANDPIPHYADPFCAKQINTTSVKDGCKYSYLPDTDVNRDVFFQMDKCRGVLPMGTDVRSKKFPLSISILMEYYCLPNIAIDEDAADANRLKQMDWTSSYCSASIEELAPSSEPTAMPSVSSEPSAEPSAEPTYLWPSEIPTVEPSEAPIIPPSMVPSAVPSLSPSKGPSIAPSDAPSLKPSLSPTNNPSLAPSETPSVAPTTSRHPSAAPTLLPSISIFPTTHPVINPSNVPSSIPSLAPSSKPSLMPSLAPTLLHSIEPSSVPSAAPTDDPCHPNRFQDQFRIWLTPGDDPSDLAFTVYARRVNDPFVVSTVFHRSNFRTSDPEQVSAKCIWKEFCMYAVVSTESGNALEPGSFRADWSHVPLQFHRPAFSTGWSVKSEQFGRCHDLPAVPSQAPSASLAPSTRPSADPCPESTAGVNQDPFKIVITPGSDPSDLSWRVFRRENGQWTNRDVFRKYGYDNSDPDQESQKCIWNRICMKVVVYSASGNGMQGGSFAAYWNGVPLHFADATFATGSSTESETFGRC